MLYSFEIEDYTLLFKKAAKTSRNIFKERKIHLVHLKDRDAKVGTGECAPLAMLSIDDREDYREVLEQRLGEFCEHGDLEKVNLHHLPSIRFGLETAIQSLSKSDNGALYDTAFTQKKSTMEVNGLVWMNDAETMYKEALQKIHAGFTTIKFKVGALDFDEECRLLEKIRKQFSAFKITLRLDANGGFNASEAEEQLHELSRFEIHSIEQPIMPNQWDDMARLCAETKIPIALDEELIGVDVYTKGDDLLTFIKPAYIILKPNLIGGFMISEEWIKLSENRNINWWATSALEGNIGLNAITQWVSQYNPKLPQGLGTGALYEENIPVPINLIKNQMKFIGSNRVS